MDDKDKNELFEELLNNIHTTSGVEKILKKYGLEPPKPVSGKIDDTIWKPLGGVEDNWNVTGNQASDARRALAERFINMIDAELLRKCREAGINPCSAQAPQSMTKAAQQFFGVPSGGLADMSIKNRSSDKVLQMYAVATGAEGKPPTITLIDRGEGQTPDNFENTLVSLPSEKHKSNKKGIPFVQGVYNSGSTGTYAYCSYTLIISKRSPKLLTQSPTDRDKQWGWTLVKLFMPSKADKKVPPHVRYMVIDGVIPSFKSDSLKPTIPDNNNTNVKNLKSGTIVKHFEYQLKTKTGSYGTAFYFFNREFNQLFWEVPLPIKLIEFRKHLQKQRGDASYILGLSTALKSQSNQSKNPIESGFPIQINPTVDILGKIGISIWAVDFSKISKQVEQSEGKLFGNTAVSLLVNGQSHYSLSDEFLTKRDVDLAPLRGSLFVAVDLTSVSTGVLSTIFKSDRGHVFEDKEPYINLIEKIKSELKNSEALQDLAQKKLETSAQTIETDVKDVEKLMGRVVKSNPFLKNILEGKGFKIVGDFDWKKKKGKPYKGRKTPTFFRLLPEKAQKETAKL